MTRKLRGTRLLAVPLLAIAAMLGCVLPASAASTPILYADSGNVAHHCEILGPASELFQAVVCVDIDTSSNSSGYYATGEVEAYCEANGSASDIVACNSIQMTGTFASATDDVQQYTWGCSAGGCPGSRNIIDIATFSYTGGKDCDTSLGHNVWTNVVDGTVISDLEGTFTLGTGSGANDQGNYSSGHYWVCP